MKRNGIKCCVLMMALLLCVGTAGTSFAAAAENGTAQTIAADRKDAANTEESRSLQVLKETCDYVYETVKEPVCGSIGGDWVLYGLKKAGYPMSESYVETYQKAVENAVKAGYRGVPGVLHDKKYTEYSRVVFTYGALGLDPTDAAGYDLLEKLADYDKVIWQGINGPIWALKALDEGNFDMPKAPEGVNQATRKKYVKCILDAQLADGGWALNGKTADPDMTAMAVQALAPYVAEPSSDAAKKHQKEVSSSVRAAAKSAVRKAIGCLSDMQNKDGTFGSWGTKNSESCAQVIWALSTVGIDAARDPRFVKNGMSVVDALLSFYDENVHGFRHVNEAGGGYEATVNQMATEQALYSLANYAGTDFRDFLIRQTAAMSLKLNGTSVKSGKNKGKVSFTFSSDSREKLKDLEDMGYRLDFYYYKALKKNGRFSYVSHKIKHNNSSLIQTKGTKGKTYYYDVKIKIRDQEGNVVATINRDQVTEGSAKWKAKTVK